MNKIKKHIFFYGIRIIAAVILLFIYLYGVRPLRRTVTRQIVLPMVRPHYHRVNHPYTITNKGVALTISFEWNNDLKTIRYQPQLGFFFLIAAVALMFITLKLRWYFILIGFHIIAMIAAIAILFFSRHGWFAGFITVDFLVTYLIPGLSFAYVAFIYYTETQVGERLFYLPKSGKSFQ